MTGMIKQNSLNSKIKYRLSIRKSVPRKNAHYHIAILVLNVLLYF